MIQQRPLVRLLFFVFSIIILMTSTGIGGNTAKATDCCVLHHTQRGTSFQYWACWIDGQWWQCEGLCDAIAYIYSCTPTPPPCDNPNKELPVWEVTGPCKSQTIACDGQYAICVFTSQPPWTMYCYIKCPQ